MQFFEQLFLSFKYYGETFRFIDRHRLYKYLVIPSLLSLGIAVIVAYLAWRTSDDVILYLRSEFNLKEFKGFIGDTIELIFSFIIRGLTLFLYLKMYRYLLLLLLSPAFMLLSQKIQKIALNEQVTFSLKTCFLNVARSVRIAFLNFFKDILISALIVIICLIVTWLAPLVPFAIFTIESYFFGFSMLDYRNQFLKISYKESRQVIHNNYGLAIGNGICFNLILLIPLIGIMFGPVLALIAAGLSIDEVENRKINDNQIRKPI